MIPVALGIHTKALLRVGAIGLGDTQTSYAEGASCCARKLSLIVEVHAATQHEVTFLFEGHGFHHLIDISCLQLLGRRAKAVAAERSYSNNL